MNATLVPRCAVYREAATLPVRLQRCSSGIAEVPLDPNRAAASRRESYPAEQRLRFPQDSQSHGKTSRLSLRQRHYIKQHQSRRRRERYHAWRLFVCALRHRVKHATIARLRLGPLLSHPVPGGQNLELL